MAKPTASRPSAMTWMAVLLLLVAGALTYVVLKRPAARYPTDPQASAAAKTSRAVTSRSPLTGKELKGTELFERLSPSVVHITSLRQTASRLANRNVVEVPQGTGSGFIWNNEGHVVTNFHVVENADIAEVMLHDGRTFRAKVLAQMAPEKDIAVLKLQTPPSDLAPIPVGTSADLLVGQEVVAIGSPFGLEQTMTRGIISALGREIDSKTSRPIYDVIQTDAAINRGNSGGPLLDSSGRLIGINTAIYNPEGGSWTGIGFSIPVDTVNRIVPRLIAGKRSPRIGLGLGTDSQARKLGITGVIIKRVDPKGPAGKTDLQGIESTPAAQWKLGDVIVGFDGKTVEKRSDLYRELDKHAPGDTITLTVQRNGNKREVAVTLAARGS